MKIKAILTHPVTGKSVKHYPLGHITSDHVHIDSISLSHESSGTIGNARSLEIIKQAIEGGAEICIKFPEVEIRLT